MGLKMWSCEIDVVIAETVEDAITIVASMHGEANSLEESLQTISDAYGSDLEEYCKDNWTEHTPENNLKLYSDDTGTTVEKTVQEWIDEQGEGYFASTEY